MKVALIGSNGTLATAFGKYCNQKEYELHVYDKNNHLLGVETPMIKDHYLKAKEKRYASSGFSVSKKTYPKYHHFKVVVHSYYVE